MSTESEGSRVEIVVTGRNVEVPEHFRIHVEEKIGRLERYDHKIVGMEVELFHEPNRRQSKNCQRVEITGRGCGPVARAEACAQDFYGALDCAISKLEGRLRREDLMEDDRASDDYDIPSPRDHGDHLAEDRDPARPGQIVRRKTHPSDPISIDEALSRMELVGHDFYLFSDAECGTPSVVYRRKGYDYGVIRLGG
jgi:ribosomal subunit interface protein